MTINNEFAIMLERTGMFFTNCEFVHFSERKKIIGKALMNFLILFRKTSVNVYVLIDFKSLNILIHYDHDGKSLLNVNDLLMSSRYCLILVQL